MLTFEQQLQASSKRLAQAVDRIRALAGGADKNPDRQEALAFNLERAAWALLEQAQAWVYEKRLGIARKETENLDLLQAHGWIELDLARRLKQLCEFRSLSAREPDRTDWSYLESPLSTELELLAQWVRLNDRWSHP